MKFTKIRIRQIALYFLWWCSCQFSFCFVLWCLALVIFVPFVLLFCGDAAVSYLFFLLCLWWFGCQLSLYHLFCCFCVGAAVIHLCFVVCVVVQLLVIFILLFLWRCSCQLSLSCCFCGSAAVSYLCSVVFSSCAAVSYLCSVVFMVVVQLLSLFCCDFCWCMCYLCFVVTFCLYVFPFSYLL